MAKSTLTFDEIQKVKAVLPKTGLSNDLQTRVYLALLRGMQLELAPETKQAVGEMTRREIVAETFLFAVPKITNE